MSSKRKREKEDSAKHKRTKKHRTITSTKVAEGTDDPSSTDETGLTTHNETSGGMLSIMENGHDGPTGSHSNRSAQEWSAQEPVGGQLLDLDPVFSNDGRYYILAYTSGVKVFSCETSLLVQSLPCAVDGPIIGISLSLSDPSSLIVGLANGQIERWTWMTGIRTAGFDIASPIGALAVVSFSDDSPAEDRVFVSYYSQDEWCVAAYAFENEHRPGEDEHSMTLVTSQSCISMLQTCENGRILVASDGHRIMIGSKQDSKAHSLKSLQYLWREFACNDTISCIKPRISLPGTAKRPPTLDLAAGTREGVIFVYRDIIGQLSAAKKSRELPTVTRLHWHRNAVATVDWSRDGNYLLSGGEETVLTLWQLNSNQKSFLPHLTAPILRAVVSPSGECYGVTLADNSSMVLRALTLEPETSISAPQLLAKDAATASSRSLAKPQASQAAPLQRGRIPISVAKSSSKLLYSTFTSDPRGNETANTTSPFLHVYDYKSGAQLSKQALARTFTTDRRAGPRGEKLQEPRVVLLQVSASEKWLATVDEWLPGPEKFAGSGPLATHGRDTRLNTLEANLRFWLWKDSKKTWEMVWKTDLSRSSQVYGFDSGKAILDLAADPHETKFYTLSQDYTVRAWYPTRRLRGGIPVKDEYNNDVSNWSHREVGVLPVPTNKTSALPSSGKIAVSKDGSLLLASVGTETGGVVGTFDGRSCKLLSVQFDKTAGPIRGLGIAGSCAVVLSDIFTAWDLVDTGRTHKAELGNPGAKRAAGRPYFHLACDEQHETFAVVSPTIDEKSLVTILSGKSLTPEAVVKLPSLVIALLPAPAQRGFLAINADSEITLITGSSQVHTAQSSDQQIVAPQNIGLDRVFGDIALRPPHSITQLRGQSDMLPSDGTPLSANQSHHKSLHNSGEADPLRQIFESSQPLSSPAVINTFRRVAAVLSKST